VGRVIAGRRLIALLAAALVAVGLPASVSAESLLWTLVASPLTASTGVQTTFTLTATNTDPAALLISDSEIGCILVDVPSNFTIGGATVTASNAGGGWHIDAITGNRVKIHTDSGGERLETFDWVRFTITATASSTGSLSWNSRAYRDQNCGGAGALLGVPPIVVVTGPAVTPTPTPTPVPTPKPSPKPTPRPTPTSTIPLPIPLPSLPLPSLPLPSPSTGLPSVGATASPSASPRGGFPTPRLTATPNPSPVGPPAAASPSAPSDGAGAPPAGPTQGRGGTGTPIGVVTATVGRDVPRLAFDPAELDIDFESVGLLSGTTVWLVPTATFAIPAVLLLLFVALQAAGALAWVPAVRRLSGRDDEVA
jgi:hypothetical protein